MNKLRIGTRGSALALRQTEIVADRLRRLHPQIEIEISIIKTKGDKILDVPLSQIGDKGLFVTELENALLAHEIDAAVHSMKDLPTDIPTELVFAAIPERADPSDVLISNGPGLSALPDGARIGSSSLRRRAQLLHFRPDFRIFDLRGNIDTRLRKLDEGEFDAIILAYAGMFRLGWEGRITEKLPHGICLPAPGQGALAIQAREDDSEALDIISKIDHPETRSAVFAERSFMKVLEGGCQIPAAALACIVDGKMLIKGMVASVDGENLICAEVTGDPNAPDLAGETLAEVLLANGAGEILRR